MEIRTNTLFPGFSREYVKMQNNLKQKGQFRSMMANETEPFKEVPEEYKAYIGHVNHINQFKDKFVSYEVVDKITNLLKTGETIQYCRDYVGNINSNWNQWEKCYDSLKRTYGKVSERASWIEDSLSDAVKDLERLVKDKGDESARRKLESSIEDILESLEDSDKSISISVSNVQEFQKKFDEKQKVEFQKIIDRLGQESTLQAAARDKITDRIKQLQQDISQYNASIAGLAIAMGVSITMVTFSFFIGGGAVAIAVGLFLLPAVAVAIAAIVKLSQKIKAATQEIESYGDYKNEYNAVITSLTDIQASVNQTLTEAEGIKQEMNDVCAPWNALKTDLEKVKNIIQPGAETDYEALLAAFKNISEMWKNIRINLSYLNLKESVTNVVQTDITSFDVDAILRKGKEKGISMDEYIAA